MNKNKVMWYLCLITVILEIVCSKDPLLVGTEITNGDCIGKIYNQDSSAAQGVVVKLIPVDYNPYLHKGKQIDSTLTDENGCYSFTVSQPDYYNILAQKGSASCMQDSISILADAKTIIDNDTLRESGKISGVVRLKPGDDNSKVIILVTGTNVYSVPSDTSGNFEIPPLPSGNYELQFFSSDEGYAVFDTNVTINEGGKAQLDVTLPSVNAPSIEQLSATLDRATMFVSLSWPIPDTSKIISYALFRKGRLVKDTMWILDKGNNSFVDDAIGLDGDSLSYQIAAIGKNYKEGFRTTSTILYICSIVQCVKEIDMSSFSAGIDPYIVTLSVDKLDRLFLVGWYGIYNLDSNGTVQRDYRLEKQDSDNKLSSLQSDNLGHLYILKRAVDTQSVVKFDADLNVISQTQINTGCQFFLVAGNNGPFYTFYEVKDSSTGNYIGTTIKEYDSAFTLRKEFNSNHLLTYNPARVRDTFVVHEYLSGNYSAPFYDPSFSLLSDIVTDTMYIRFYGNPQYSREINYDGIFAAPFGIFVSVFKGNFRNCSSLLLFTDRNGKFLARVIVPSEWGGLVFDSKGNFYFLTYLYTDEDDMGPEFPLKKLYKYSMASLLSIMNP